LLGSVFFSRSSPAFDARQAVAGEFEIAFARSTEALLIGQRIDETVARNAAHSALDGAHPLTMNRYKLPLFETLIRRALLQAASQA
jgi:CO/xanthine dehydrogenase FAD-binding subunit